MAMDAQDRSRAELALPNPQEQAGVPEIELLESSKETAPKQKPASAPVKLTWSSLLKKELEFLGVTQILIGFLCLCFGIIVYFVLRISNFDEEEMFSSFNAGFPFWGAVLFVISGVLSVLSERRKAMYLARGRLGANTLSSVAAATGIIILVFNLSSSSAYVTHCDSRLERNDDCLVASFITEVVCMLLFLTILELCTTVSLTVYGIGEECRGKKLPDDRLYEELNIYSPIYSELEDKGGTSPADS